MLRWLFAAALLASGGWRANALVVLQDPNTARRVLDGDPQHRSIDMDPQQQRSMDMDMDPQPRAGNPAGCIFPKTDKSIDELGGVWPVEEFKSMLATRTGQLYHGGRPDVELSKKLHVPWCPEPLAGSPFEEKDQEVSTYMRSQLSDIDSSQPLLVSVVQVSTTTSYAGLQLANFVCGLQRLRVLHRSVFIALDERSADNVRRLFPDLRVLWHAGFTQVFERITMRTHVFVPNRVAKLVIASMLLEQGREIIISDLDMYWAEDPSTTIQSLMSDHELDFAAMKDFCWLEINSGFLYYRPTEPAKELVRMALSTVKFTDYVDGTQAVLVSDNDQYLLNCALARAAVMGLNYTVLPFRDFRFIHPPNCRESTENLADVPKVWHTSGFSGTYENQIDTFVSLGMMDVDPDVGRCQEGSRGSPGDLHEFTASWSRLCSTGPGGVQAPICESNCRSASSPSQAKDFLARYLRGWKLQ